MARYVKVASLPAETLKVPDTRDYEAVLQAEQAYWQRQLDQVTCDHPDLIVTPECCDRPLNTSGDRKEEFAYYRVRGARMRDFFAEKARRHHCNIAYSAVWEMPDGTWRNAIQMINRQGGIDGMYNKYLLTFRETEYTKFGKDCHAIETDMGRVCGAICFDLNFDEPLKLTAAQKPDMTLFCSWYHGGLMQRYWAYITRSYLITCIGGAQTANVINPVGEVVAESSNYYPYVSTTINLDYKVAHLDHNMGRFEAMKKKYGERVEICTPFGLGCSLLTCKDEKLTMDEIAKEFEIEMWDDYYARSMAARYVPGRIEE